MPVPYDAHELHVRAAADLASLAFGESVDPDVGQHVAGCRPCQDELTAYRRVVALGREAGSFVGMPADGRMPAGGGMQTGGGMQRNDSMPAGGGMPPAAVWSRIAAEVGIAPSAPGVGPVAAPAGQPLAQRAGQRAGQHAGQRRRPVRSTRSRRTVLALAAAAAVVLTAGGGLAGWAVGHSSAPSTPAEALQAPLQAQPGTTLAAHGTATMHAAPAGYAIDVQTAGLRAPSGYYEVWLLDPSIGHMVAIGTLGVGGRGSFTVPGGIDVQAYHVVDVSIQRFDGNAAHGTSALRGSLTH